MEIKTSFQISKKYEHQKEWVSINSLFEYFEYWTELTKQDLEDYLEHKGELKNE